MLSSMGVQGTGYPKYKDPKQPLIVRINDLLSRMTLAEKIGQMSQIERSVATPDVIKNDYIGMHF
jgi:beta-glucosidase